MYLELSGHLHLLISYFDRCLMIFFSISFSSIVIINKLMISIELLLWHCGRLCHLHGGSISMIMTLLEKTMYGIVTACFSVWEDGIHMPEPLLNITYVV